MEPQIRTGPLSAPIARIPGDFCMLRHSHLDPARDRTASPWPLGPAAFPWPGPAKRQAERPWRRQAGLDGICRGNEPPDHVAALPVRRRSRDGHACRFAPRAGSFPDRTGVPATPAVSAKRHGPTRPPCDGGRRQARACRRSTPQEARTEALSRIWATSPPGCRQFAGCAASSSGIGCVRAGPGLYPGIAEPCRTCHAR